MVHQFSVLFNAIRRRGLVTLLTLVAVMVVELAGHAPLAHAAPLSVSVNSCSSLYPTNVNHWVVNGSTTYTRPTVTAGGVTVHWGNQLYVQGSTSTLAQWSWNGSTYLAACANFGDLAYTSSGTAAFSNGGYGWAFQCVELILRYMNARYGITTSTWNQNASYFWGHHPSQFAAEPNGDFVAPAVGDIIVWGPADSNGNPQPTWGAGHVAIVESVGSSTLTVFEQNWGSVYGTHQLYYKQTFSINYKRYYYEVGYDTYNAAQWGNGPGGTDMRDDTGHVIYGWLAPQ